MPTPPYTQGKQQCKSWRILEHCNFTPFYAITTENVWKSNSWKFSTYGNFGHLMQSSTFTNFTSKNYEHEEDSNLFGFKVGIDSDRYINDTSFDMQKLIKYVI